MTFFEKISLIERLDQLINMKATGPSKDLAPRLGVSRSTLFEVLDVMRSMGAELDYCKIRKTYYYTKEKVFSIGFVPSDKIQGGKNNSNYFLESGFFGLS